MEGHVTLRVGLAGPRQARARLREVLVAGGHAVVSEGPGIEDALAEPVEVLVATAAGEGVPLAMAPGVPAVVLGYVPAPLSGPAAFLSAGASAEQLLAAILAVAAGLTVSDPALGPETAPSLAGEGKAEPLTAREREVLVLLADGLPNKAIARELGISENTAKYHVAAILAKLDAQSRADAVMRAARAGLLPL